MSEYRGHEHIRSYVKRATRMSASQKRAYDSHWEQYCLSAKTQGEISRLEAEARTPAIQRLFSDSDSPLVVEIGFGMGDATAEIAAANPGTNYLGIEVHRPGVGKLLRRLSESGTQNVLIVERDAIPVLEELISPASLAGVHLFFPDPWPKKRHHKRRLVRPNVVNVIADRLAPGGYLYMVTDWQEYADSALEVIQACTSLVNQGERFTKREAWRPTTAFERKGRSAGRKIVELQFRRE